MCINKKKKTKGERKENEEQKNCSYMKIINEYKENEKNIGIQKEKQFGRNSIMQENGCLKEGIRKRNRESETKNQKVRVVTEEKKVMKNEGGMKYIATTKEKKQPQNP